MAITKKKKKQPTNIYIFRILLYYSIRSIKHLKFRMAINAALPLKLLIICFFCGYYDFLGAPTCSYFYNRKINIYTTAYAN
jgi:hypothetical protein